MNPNDPNVAKVEFIAQALGELREKMVFAGGCAVGLLLTDPAAAPPRVTYDVDLIAEVTPLAAYHPGSKASSRAWAFSATCRPMHPFAAGATSAWKWT